MRWGNDAVLDVVVVRPRRCLLRGVAVQVEFEIKT